MSTEMPERVDNVLEVSSGVRASVVAYDSQCPSVDDRPQLISCSTDEKMQQKRFAHNAAMRFDIHTEPPSETADPFIARSRQHSNTFSTQALPLLLLLVTSLTNLSSRHPTPPRKAKPTGCIMVSTLASIALATIAACATLVPQVDAHGYIISPKAQTNGKGHPGTFVIEYPPPWTGNWKDPKNFAAAAKEKGFATLRSYLEDKGAVCGFTDPNVAPRAIPADRKVTFSRDIPHAGPCELWIDDKRVYQNDDCESAFTGVIPSWDVDWTLCSGECMIRFYWLGLQASGTRWQVYKSCVPVSGTVKATDSGKTTTPKSTTKAPSKSKTPKPTTKAPSKSKTPKPTAEVGGEGETSMSTPKNGTMELDVGCKAKVSSE